MNEKSNQAKRQQFGELSAKKYSAILTPRIIKTASLNGIAVKRIGTLEILERFFKVDFLLRRVLLLCGVCCLLGVPLKSTSNISPPRLANETRTTTSSAKLQVTSQRAS